MRLVIQDTNHPFKREIVLIFNLLKGEEDELIFSDTVEDGYSVRLQYLFADNKIKAVGEANINNRILSFINERDSSRAEKEIKAKAKQAISYVWLKLLESITGEKHGWGILTGIRPTKLYHKLLQTNDHQQVAKLLRDEYLLEPDKIALLREIVERQLKVIPDLYEIDNEVSIYIGIPFCPTKCAYCTFPAYGINEKSGSVEAFLKGLHREIDIVGKWLHESNRQVSTIYFGGGTPTSIEAQQLDEVLSKLNQWVDLKSVREITVEAGRPDTISTDKLIVLKKWNINRISINPQSFRQETLDAIGRYHTVGETIQKFHLARENNINNINMDLIIGLPSETLNEFRYSLEQIEKLMPESLTIHTMAFKRASYLTQNKEKFNITEKKEAALMMDYARLWTEKHDYQPYYLYRQKNMLGNLENIGYSVKNKESLYNILIMEEKQTIIGLGSGAVSKLIPPKTDKVIRFPNPKEPKTYIETIESITARKIAKLNEIFQMRP